MIPSSNIEVIIPWQGGCPYRERALAYVESKLVDCGYQVRRGEVRLGGAWPGLAGHGEGSTWNKALAVMPAVEASFASVIVLHDADCWTDGLSRAIRAVENGSPWAIPHSLVHRVNEVGTDAVLAGERWQDQELDQPSYSGMVGGGIVVLPRETFLEIPLDPRFAGWGQEDESWGLACWTMLGPPWRGHDPLVHLWHPPMPRLTRKVGSIESQDVARLYHRARMRPDQMKIVLGQAREAYRTYNKRELSWHH